MYFYTFNDKCQVFMHAFMYELEVILKANIEPLKQISFQSDEANTDRPLKEFVKRIILENLTSLIGFDGNKVLKIERDELEPIICKYHELFDISIIKVLLPNEIDATLKLSIAENKTSVYTNPDILLLLTNNENTCYIPIELKSTKDNEIPGSSVQQITKEEWVIFVKHSKNIVNICTGQYIHSINSKLQFPDRSPRPKVAFNELFSWNQTFRRVQDNSITYIFNKDAEKSNHELIENWQNYLADQWINIIFSESKINRNPWFHNNLRIFIVKFIEKYNTLTQTEQQNLVNKLNQLIETCM